MARARNIKPGICLNDILAGLDHWVRLLFIYIWTIADRDGRLVDNPKRIGASVFPYEALPIDEGLSQLDQCDFIRRYSAGEGRFIQIVNWEKHQNPHPKEAASTIPASAGCVTEQAMEKPRQVTAMPRQVTASPEQDTGKPERAGLIPSSLIPDSLIPDSLSPSSGERPASGIAEFLAAYPKKTRSDPAARAYLSMINSHAEHVALMEGLQRWLRSDQWVRSLRDDRGRFIPDPDKFIIDGRYNDKPEPHVDDEDSGESLLDDYERGYKDVA